MAEQLLAELKASQMRRQQQEDALPTKAYQTCERRRDEHAASVDEPTISRYLQRHTGSTPVPAESNLNETDELDKTDNRESSAHNGTRMSIDEVRNPYDRRHTPGEGKSSLLAAMSVHPSWP